MKKRILSLVLALMLALALMPMAALAASEEAAAESTEATQEPAADEAVPLALEGDGSESSALQGSGTTDVPWILTQDEISKVFVSGIFDDCYYLQSGTYRLDGDITVDKNIHIRNAAVAIDLNGYTLKSNADSGTLLYLSRSDVSATVRLTLVDNSTEKTGEVRFDNGWAVNLGSNTAFDGTSVPIYGKVEGATISGGIFYGEVNGGTITGGTFYGTVTNNGGTITGGTFYGEVNMDGTQGISGGTFYGKVNIISKITISGGIFYGGITGNPTISGNTVTFMKDSTNDYAKVIVASGSTVTKPDEPTPPTANDCFGGWYEKDADGNFKSSAFDFSTNITDPITLYAKWQSHTGGTATCKDKAKCEVCGEEYGEIDEYNHTGGTENINAKAATCTEYGYTGDTYCKGCGVKLAEGTGIVPLDHVDENKDHVCDRESCKETISTCSGGTATCTEKAVCDYCGKEYGEVDSASHATLKHVEAKAATVEAEGNIEYWHCEACGKYFRDEVGKEEIELSDTVIEKLTPTPTPAPTATPATAPHTADEANVALWLALAAMSAMGLAVVTRKKEN